MNFGEAIEHLKKGGRASRPGWNGKGMWIGIDTPGDDDELPYVFMITADDKIVPWVASQTEMLAEDWVTI